MPSKELSKANLKGTIGKYVIVKTEFRRRGIISKRLREIYNFEIEFRRRGILCECLGQIKIPSKKDTKVVNFKILKFESPWFLKALSSPFSNNLIKKNCEVSKKIKGNIS